MVSREALRQINQRGIPSPADARTCYSSLKLSDLVGFLDATDRVPARTAEAAGAHIGAAAVEGEEVGVAVVVRPGRPIVAVAASRGGIAALGVTAAGSREKDLRGTLKISVITTEITAFLTSYCCER